MITIVVTDRYEVIHQLKAETGVNLMRNLQSQPWGVEGICGGTCACATCHVYIGDAWVDKVEVMESEEEELLEFVENRLPNSRLGCQIKCTDDLDGMPITIAPES